MAICVGVRVGGVRERERERRKEWCVREVCLRGERRGSVCVTNRGELRREKTFLTKCRVIDIDVLIQLVHKLLVAHTINIHV